MAGKILSEIPPDLRPASFEEEQDFSSETMYSKRPFGVHKFWLYLDPKNPQLWEMLHTCPEAWNIVPHDILAIPEWKNVLCSTEGLQDVVRHEILDVKDFCH
jgi:hypothetical protein